MTEKKGDSDYVRALLDRSVKEMTKRIAGIELVLEEFQEQHRLQEWDSLFIETSGDYNAEVVMSAERAVFCEIARNMKRNRVISDKDIVIYITEYYNMVCGFFISHLNHTKKLKSKFCIPKFVRGQHFEDTRKDFAEVALQYRCDYGKMQVFGNGLPENRR